MSNTTQSDVAAKTGQKEPSTPAARVSEPMARLRGEMARLFDDFFAGPPSWFGHRGTGDSSRRSELLLGPPVPAFDLTDLDTKCQITAELPGMGEEDLEVKLVNHVLTIQGEKKEETKEEKVGYFLSERRFGVFQRSFRLPDDIDVDKIRAQFENGVLTVDLPKVDGAAAQGKRIRIKKK